MMMARIRQINGGTGRGEQVLARIWGNHATTAGNRMKIHPKVTQTTTTGSRNCSWGTHKKQIDNGTLKTSVPLSHCGICHNGQNTEATQESTE